MKASSKSTDLAAQLSQEDDDKRNQCLESIEKQVADPKLTQEQYKKIWKSVCKGFANLKGQKAQIDLAKRASKFLSKLSTKNKANVYTWFKWTLESISQVWTTAPRFLSLTRFLLTEAYTKLETFKWDKKKIEALNKNIWEFLQVQFDKNNKNNGFAKQIVEIFVEVLLELNDPNHQTFQLILDPFLDLLFVTKPKPLLKLIFKSVFMFLEVNCRQGHFSTFNALEYGHYLEEFEKSKELEKPNKEYLNILVLAFTGKVGGGMFQKHEIDFEHEVEDELKEKKKNTSKANGVNQKRKREDLISDIKEDSKKKGSPTKEKSSSPSSSPSKSAPKAEPKEQKKATKGKKNADTISPEPEPKAKKGKKGQQKSEEISPEPTDDKKAPKKGKAAAQENTKAPAAVTGKDRKGRSKAKKEDEIQEEEEEKSTQKGKKSVADRKPTPKKLKATDIPAEIEDEIDLAKVTTAASKKAANTKNAAKTQSKAAPKKNSKKLVRQQTPYHIPDFQDDEAAFESDEEDFLEGSDDDDDDGLNLSDLKQPTNRKGGYAEEESDDEEEEEEDEEEDEFDEDDEIFEIKEQDYGADPVIKSIIGEIPPYFQSAPRKKKKLFERLDEEYTKNIKRAQKMMRAHKRKVHFDGEESQFKEFNYRTKVSIEKIVPSSVFKKPSQGILRKKAEAQDAKNTKKISGKPQKKVKI